MDPSSHQINTQRLRPLCQRTSRTVMSILENGDISMEILAKPPAGNQEGNQTVQEVMHISGDGAKVQFYQNNQGGAGGKGLESCWTHQELVYPHLPPKQLKKYIHAYRFVELVKSKTPKIILTTDRAKCKLMENSPSPDFQADFYDGMCIQLSKRKVQVTDCQGNSATCDMDTLSQSFPENILERCHYSKQCESECLRLVDSFNSLKMNGECPQLFPLSIGTSTSPVVIPLVQLTVPSDSTSLSSLHPTGLCEDHTHHPGDLMPCGATPGMSPSLPCYSNSLSSIQSQCVDHHPNVETACSLGPNIPCDQQQLYNTPHDPHSQRMNQPENIYSHPHLEHDSSAFHLPSNYIQSSLLNIDNGAKIPTTTSDVPHRCQSSLENQDGQRGQMSTCSRPGDSLCLTGLISQPQSDFCGQVSQGQNASEYYNKFKYCSNMPDSLHKSELQQDISPDEFFPEHLDISGLRVTGNETSYQSQTPPSSLSLDSGDSPSQQHMVNTQPPQELIHTTPQSFHSSSDISIHSHTFNSFASSNDKRNVAIASSSNNSSGVVENFSSGIKPEISDQSESLSYYTPIQSSSAVSNTSYPDPNPSPQSPKKVQRRGLSLDLSAALENQMKSLDLSSSRSDSLNVSTPQSAGSDKGLYSNMCSTLLKNTPRNVSFNSICNISDRLRARQDQLNSSLPLSYDSNSKQYGILTVPSTPQKQFLQSSDSSMDQGHSDFSLPPQVRHSLDLSTSSNYSDSPSSSQSSSCEPLYQVFVPYTGWASYYASGAMWVLYNDGTQLGVKANEKTMTFIDQDGSQKKYNNKDVVPDIIKMKLEKFPSILKAVLNYQR